MSSTQKAVYFFCMNLDIDPVAGHVFAALSKIYSLVEANIVIDDNPVLKHTDDQGNEFYFVRTSKVIHHDYTNYLPIMNRYFSNFDMAGLVTWHEGQNAPDKIFPVHTIGDVDTGYFGSANPVFMHNLFMSLEKNRITAGLEDFRITTEGTHWSGAIFDGTPDIIPQFPVPLVDIEIGSTASSWSNLTAAEVIAHALAGVFTGSGKT
jgi:D-tyrosyl-tRNA(Tyr) deacylase